MPTKRTRTARYAAISAEAQAWLRTPDADLFFRDPWAYIDKHDLYGGPVQKLPGRLPHWYPLPEVLGTMRDGGVLEQNAQAAVPFIEALEAAYREMRRG